MFNRKARRITQLEQRIGSLSADLAAARDDSDTYNWNSRSAQSIATALITRTRERDAAKRELRATEDQLGAARQENALRSRKQVAQVIAATLRLARALRACARYRAEIAHQRAEAAAQDAVIQRLTGQLFDAIGYQPAERNLLDPPTAEQVTA